MVSYSFLESESSSSYHDWNISPMQFLDRINRKNKKNNLIYSEKKDKYCHLIKILLKSMESLGLSWRKREHL
jgi:hypothetical protein